MVQVSAPTFLPRDDIERALGHRSFAFQARLRGGAGYLATRRRCESGRIDLSDLSFHKSNDQGPHRRNDHCNSPRLKPPKNQ